MATYNLNDYRAYIRISHNKHIMVEGKRDKRFFMDLLDILFDKYGQPLSKDQVNIDSAEELTGNGFEGIYSNREKVEHVCTNIAGTQDAEKLAGFVDREFREFGWGDVFEDQLCGHNVRGRIVWSRGHSIENYFFDTAQLYTALSTFSLSENYKEALRRFEGVFESVIRSACTASLVGLELGKLSLVKHSIDWTLIDLGASNISIKFQEWKNALIKRHKVTEPQAQELIDRYNAWHEKVNNADFQTIRWLCHGHIGFAFIWAVYTQCTYDVCGHLEENERYCEARRVVGADEKIRSNVCIRIWSKDAVDSNNYPSEVFNLIGLRT